MKNNQFLRKTLLSLAIGALLAMMVAPASATIFVAAEYPFANVTGGNGMIRTHPSVDPGNSAWGENFNVTVTGYLASVQVVLTHEGAPVGTIGCRIYGTGNSLTNQPNSTIIETSTTTYDAATLTDWDLTNGTDDICTFNFSGTHLLTENEKYAVVVYMVSATGMSVSNIVYISYDASGSYGGSYWRYGSGVWNNEDTAEMAFRVNVQSTEGTPTPSPFGDAEWDATIANFTSFVVPLFVVILPMLLLMLITKSHDKWVILIGITIGVGLGYYFSMVPLWLVFLVTIGLIGMAYQSVRGGNS